MCLLAEERTLNIFTCSHLTDAFIQVITHTQQEQFGVHCLAASTCEPEPLIVEETFLSIFRIDCHVFFFSLLFLYPEGSECVTRESMVSGHTSVSSTVPIARFSEEEKRVSIMKAPHYEGIGPVDESGIPIAIRTVRSNSHTTRIHTGV